MIGDFKGKAVGKRRLNAALNSIHGICFDRNAQSLITGSLFWLLQNVSLELLRPTANSSIQKH